MSRRTRKRPEHPADHWRKRVEREVGSSFRKTRNESATPVVISPYDLETDPRRLSPASPVPYDLRVPQPGRTPDYAAHSGAVELAESRGLKPPAPAMYAPLEGEVGPETPVTVEESVPIGDGCLCPFWGQPCLQGRCCLWNGIDLCVLRDTNRMLSVILGMLSSRQDMR